MARWRRRTWGGGQHRFRGAGCVPGAHKNPMWLWGPAARSPLRGHEHGPSFAASPCVKDRAMTLSEVATVQDQAHRTPRWAAYGLSVVFVAVATLLAVAVE